MRRIRFITQCAAALLIQGLVAFPAMQWYAAYSQGESHWGAAIGFALLAIVSLGLIGAALIQRIHDFGRSAWWLIILLVPLVNLLVLFALTCVPGQSRSNPYGAPVRRNSLLTWLVFFLVVLLPIGLVPAATIYIDTHFSR